MSGIRRFIRQNSLSLFGVIFLAALAGQAIAGHIAFNQDQLAHHEPAISIWRYVTSSSFGNAVMENWQSEYLQFTLMMMALIFSGSWFAQSITGMRDYNANQRAHHEPTVSYSGYVTGADFWEATLQNWQSEFLAVGSFAVFAIYLRQHGSPESKRVGAPHDAQQ